MTEKENQTLKEIQQLMTDIRRENEFFKAEVKKQVEDIILKVDKKELPITLEKDVLYAVNDSIRDALKKVLVDYNSPLKKYAENIITKYQKEIESVFDNIVSSEIASIEFRENVKEALLNKIARTVITGIDGNVDKLLNQMKQDQVFRSKLTLMVNSLIDEFVKTK